MTLLSISNKPTLLRHERLSMPGERPAKFLTRPLSMAFQSPSIIGTSRIVRTTMSFRLGTFSPFVRHSEWYCIVSPPSRNTRADAKTEYRQNYLQQMKKYL